jgi:parvulin-like peptidyl-prolyl isomerase
VKPKSLHLFIIILPLLGLLGCSATLSKTSYLAKVNQEVITMEDLRREFKKRHGGHEKFLAGEDEARRFLNKVLESRLLIEEAYRIGLDEDPEIQEPTDRFREKILVEYLLKKEVEDKSIASEDEIKSVYDQKLEELVLVQQIVVSSKEEAESILKRLQAGENFESIAREKSIAPSKIYGGRLTYVGWGAMDPEWERAAFSLSSGDLSPVFKSKMGYEILRLVEKKTMPKPDFSKVRPRIKAILERRKLEARGKEFMDSVRGKYALQFIDYDLGVDHMKKVKEEKKEDPVATWKGGSVTAYRLALQLNFDSLSSLPSADNERVIKEILETMVNEKLVLTESLAAGYDKVPEVSEKVRHYQEGLMENKLYGKYILTDMKTTEEEIQNYFEQNRNRFTFPEMRRVAHILVDSLDTAKEALKRLREGTSFESLAREFSKDTQNAKRGGEVGWIQKGQVLLPIENAAFSMNAGEVSDPVQTDLGYHIIKVLEMRPSQLKDFAQAKIEVEKKVLQKKREEKIKYWTDQLRAASKIEINEAGIKAAVKEIQREFDKKPKKKGMMGNP